MNDIAVIVVNWNACVDLKECLQSLYTDPPGDISYEVWVVDNASEDGSVDMVRTEYPQVNLMENSTNVGFSKANNQAIQASNTKYVFLLNSDAAVHSGTLETLGKYANANPTSAIIGPKVLNRDGSLQFSCRRFPVIWAGFFRNTLLGRLAPNNKFARAYLMEDFDHSKTGNVDWLSGCAMFIRRDLIDIIGPLDERFYMYCEDVDICWRAWNIGQKVVYMPDAVVTHAIGRSSDKNAEKMIVEFHRSWFEYDKKRHPNDNPLRRAVVFSGLWLRAAIRIFNRRNAERRQRKSETK